MQHSDESIFVVEYFREYESISETALTHVLGQGYCLKKKPELKNLVRLSLSRKK
jgi:hypothetical protein